MDRRSRVPRSGNYEKQVARLKRLTGAHHNAWKPIFACHRIPFAIHKSCTLMQFDPTVILSRILAFSLLHPRRFALRVMPCHTPSGTSSVQVLSKNPQDWSRQRFAACRTFCAKNMATRRRGLGLGIFNERKKLQSHPDGLHTWLALHKKRNQDKFSLRGFIPSSVAFSRWNRCTGLGTAGRSRAAGRDRH